MSLIILSWDNFRFDVSDVTFSVNKWRVKVVTASSPNMSLIHDSLWWRVINILSSFTNINAKWVIQLLKILWEKPFKVNIFR